MGELEQVKAIIGLVDDSEDDLITLLLERAGDIIKLLSVSHKDYKHLKVDAVVVAYNQRGAEGNVSTSSGGFNQTWAYTTMYDYIRNNLPARYVIK